jgi:threonine dehydratase
MAHYHNTSTNIHPPRPKTTNIYADIVKAEQRIRKYLYPTPLIYSPYFSTIVNSKLQSGHSNPCRVFLKLESENVTGSFKVRGAFNKVLISKEKGTFSDWKPSTRVLTKK